MTKKKKNAGLAQPVAPTKWAQIRDAERVSYAVEQPTQLSWKKSDSYACPELQHRSAANQPPSLVLGQRVSKGRA